MPKLIMCKGTFASPYFLSYKYTTKNANNKIVSVKIMLKSFYTSSSIQLILGHILSLLVFR